ncbi:hypothetical protein [Brevibacillus sp. 179-C9.3 HS]|uniref:hypothetical protein n=1 Tax=unclassified Brevibacillus TaxID=2684853 RepID=UPI0039A0CC6B
MEKWKSIVIDGVTSIDKVVAKFNIWSINKLPFPKFKVKIREEKSGVLFGSTNVAVKSDIDGEPDWISGHGRIIAEALEDTIISFFSTLDGFTDLVEEDFVWADIHDF